MASPALSRIGASLLRFAGSRAVSRTAHTFGFAVVLAFSMAVAGAGAVFAQDTSVGFQATRIELQNRATSLETELADPKLNSSKRKAAQAELDNVRDRLSNGDFQTGDLLVVTTNIDDKITVDTATVREGGMITISQVPDMSVAGVLRSEVQEKVREHIDRDFKRFEVRVNFSTRITVTGAVGRPGTFNVSPDRPLTDVLVVAGAAPNAKVDELEVRRSGRTIISNKQSKKLLFEGQTLAQVGIKNGDEFIIPGTRKVSWQAVTQTLLLLSSLTFALISFLRYYYSEE